jgi:hypothetical protein
MMAKRGVAATLMPGLRARHFFPSRSPKLASCWLGPLTHIDIAAHHHLLGLAPVPCRRRLQFRLAVLDSKGPCPRFAAGRTNPFASVRAQALPFVLSFGDNSGLAPEKVNTLLVGFANLARTRANLLFRARKSDCLINESFTREAVCLVTRDPVTMGNTFPIPLKIQKLGRWF